MGLDIIQVIPRLLQLLPYAQNVRLRADNSLVQLPYLPPTIRVTVGVRGSGIFSPHGIAMPKGLYFTAVFFLSLFLFDA